MLMRCNCHSIPIITLPRMLLHLQRRPSLWEYVLLLSNVSILHIRYWCVSTSIDYQRMSTITVAENDTISLIITHSHHSLKTSRAAGSESRHPRSLTLSEANILYSALGEAHRSLSLIRGQPQSGYHIYNYSYSCPSVCQ